MSSQASSSGGGVGFFGLLTVVFIVLKLTGVIAWSWFWVLSPAIFSFGLAVILMLIALIITVIVGMRS